MLFGVSFCKRKAVKRKSAGSACLRVCRVILAALLAVLLLFLAPHWLLVLLVVLLAAAVVFLIARSV